MTPLPPPSPSGIVLPRLNNRPPRRSGFRRTAAWLIALLLLGGGAYAAWEFLLPRFLLTGPRDRPLTAVVQRGELIVAVADRGELDAVSATQVICETMGGGKIASIIDEGKLVKKGQEIAKLDTDQLTKALNEQDVRWQAALGKLNSARSDLAQARNKAESEIAKAELALAEATIDLESFKDEQGEYRKELDEKKGKLELAKKELKETEDDYTFTKGLVKDGYAPLEQLRPKELAIQQRKFQVTSAEADVVLFEKFTRRKKITKLEATATEAGRELKRTKETQKSIIEKAESELKSAEGTEKIEKSQLERLKEQVDRCTILAPSDGIVVYSNSRYWDESARIRPGAQLYYRQEILSLPDLSKMKVKLKIHESMIKKIQVGMPATMTLDSLANRTLHGKVTKIATIAQSDGWRGQGVKQYETEISIDDLPSDAGLKPGMSADVKIKVSVLADAISAPISAVTEFEGSKVVYVVENGKAIRRAVIVGENNENYVQILEGLDPGEAVALDARARAAAELKTSNAATIQKTPATNKLAAK